MNELTQQILERLDIVDVIQSYIPLQPKGKSFIGICPFHQDSKPSLTVSREKQIFKCFACGEGGNAITFIQKYNNISYKEALKIAGERAGIKVELNSEKYKLPARVTRVYELNQQIVQLSNYLLHQDAEAKDYLNNRGLNLEIADKFGMGIFHDTDQLKQYLLAKGFTEAEMIENGIINRQGTSMWTHRLMIPIKDPNGHVTGFSARLLKPAEGQPKYVNSIDSEVFKKGNLLYNMNEAYKTARIKKYILLVEGNVDVQQLTAHGYDNAVATMGTALTEAQIKLLKRLNVQVVLCMDGDRAGMNATEKNYHLLKHAGIEAECVLLPNGQDPDECLREDPERFKELLAAHPHFLDFKLAAYQPTSFNETQKFILDYLRILSVQNNPLAEGYFIKKLSDVTGFDSVKIKAQYEILKPDQSRRNYEVKVKKSATENTVDWQKRNKALINFKNKPRLNYKTEIAENFDKKENKVVAFDKDKTLDRCGVLEKYVEHKGAVLETTITLMNYEKDVEAYAQNIADEVLNKLSYNLQIDRSNLNYIGYLHLDTKYPHLHIQTWQNEPFKSEYKIDSKLIEQLEKAVDLEMQKDVEVMETIQVKM